jgi:hypothetical protein
LADPNARVMWAQLARLDVTTVAARALQQSRRHYCLATNAALIRRADWDRRFLVWSGSVFCSAPAAALPFARADACRQSLRGCGRSAGERERRSGWRGGVVGRRGVDASLPAPSGTSHDWVRRGARRGARKRERPLTSATRLSPRPSTPATIAPDSGGGILEIEIAREARVDDRRQQLVRAAGRPRAASAGFVDAGPAGQPARPPGHADWTPPRLNREAGFDEP